MSDHRFFATSDAVYEGMRTAVDAAWGYPTAVGTQTCVEPASERPHDSAGRALKAIRLDWLSWEPVASMIAGAVSAGIVVEIDEAAYWSAIKKFDRSIRPVVQQRTGGI